MEENKEDKQKPCLKIYIRHAEKSYTNGNSDIYKHDPGITSYGVKKAKKTAKFLVKEWGEPTFIICSPYRRTRETAHIMNSVLKNPIKEILIDVNISEYLGNHNDVPIDITDNTSIYEPPHPETFDQMKKRVKKHYDKMNRYIKNKFNQVIWIISHGLIIEQISKLSGIKISKHFPPLTCLTIQEDEEMIKSQILYFKDKNRIKETRNIFTYKSKFEDNNLLVET